MEAVLPSATSVNFYWRLQGDISQRNVFFIVASVRISNPITVKEFEYFAYSLTDYFSERLCYPPSSCRWSLHPVALQFNSVFDHFSLFNLSTRALVLLYVITFFSLSVTKELHISKSERISPTPTSNHILTKFSFVSVLFLPYVILPSYFNIVFCYSCKKIFCIDFTYHRADLCSCMLPFVSGECSIQISTGTSNIMRVFRGFPQFPETAAGIASFQFHSGSSFICRPSIRRCIV
jgi:hypothetical protein